MIHSNNAHLNLSNPDIKNLIVSDLHLSPTRRHITQGFIKLINQFQHDINRLYILGDLFDYWVGDDYSDSEVEPIKTCLRNLHNQHIQTFFIRGNRDFLIADRFAQQTGISILEDESIIPFNGQPALITHGDQLCTKDTEHQQFRAIVRTPGWQQAFLQKSLEERIQLAEAIRSISKTNSSRKPEDIMDVDPKAINNLMETQGLYQLIHGHTHRPAIHHISINNQAAQRIVLGDWDKTGWYLTDINGHTALERFTL